VEYKVSAGKQMPEISKGRLYADAPRRGECAARGKKFIQSHKCSGAGKNTLFLGIFGREIASWAESR